MPLHSEASKRAEGVGYYTSYSSTADDVLGYLSGNLDGVEVDKPTYYGYDGKVFKVTVIVEEQ